MRSLRLQAFLCVTLLAGCTAPQRSTLTPDRALDGFREASPVVADLVDRAAAVAIFVGVEDSVAGATHEGVLVLPGGAREPIALRSLEEPSAPAGHSYHLLVALGDARQVEALRAGALELDGFARLALHEERERPDLGAAPGWIVTTRRPHLLFGEAVPRHRLERGP